MTESEFTVQEAYTRDIGQGVARIDLNTMDNLNIASGDIVDIMGKRRAVSKCLQLYPADEGKKIIRVDGLTRNNCGVEIGDVADIRKIKSSIADSVMIAPMEAIPPFDPRYVADALDSVPVIPEQFIMIPYFGGRLTFQVVGTLPEISDDVKAVIVAHKTQFGILEKKVFSALSKRDIEDTRRSFLQKIWAIEKLSKSEFDDFLNKLTEFYDSLSKFNKRNEN